jgi:CheY-like chemotaxis protein
MRYLQTLPVGAVLLDLDLTDMNGLTLLEQMRRDEQLRQIPVVIISASDPPPSFDIQPHGNFQVLLNRALNRKELADIVNATLHEVSPTFKAEPESGGELESEIIRE